VIRPSVVNSPGTHHQRRASDAQGTVRFVDLTAQAAELEGEVLRAISRVIERGDFILGEEVRLFEEEFAAYCGSSDCVGVDNGFSALELSLRAAGIGVGDEVITQANTFVATISAILAVGAMPVLVDCDGEGAVDPDAVDAAIGPRTRAIMPVHLFGRLGDVETVLEVAARSETLVIEDAAQAHGAMLVGRRAGSFGIAAGFSFYPGKNLGAYGDGGAIVTGSAELAERARAIRHYGQRVKYKHELTPLNRRLDTIQAAVLRIKLRHLDDWNRRRGDLADAYRAGLEGLPLDLPGVEQAGRHVYHLFVVGSDRREALRAHLEADDIESGVHYPVPCHLQPVLAHLGHRRGDFPNTERLAERSLSLPMYPELPAAQLERTVQSIRRFLLG
jgi:dTDP-4-amino-4,6-dideoxygalactose transaminase